MILKYATAKVFLPEECFSFGNSRLTFGGSAQQMHYMEPQGHIGLNS